MIYPQLIADCHHLGHLASGALLLHRNAALPWFILVPAADEQDLLDLPADTLALVMADCQRISEFIKRTLGHSKLNFASIGNVVPQLHLHIIGRNEQDACWPRPVWGNLPDGPAYSVAELSRWTASLEAAIGLAPGE